MINKVRENMQELIDAISDSYAEHPVSESQFKRIMPNKTIISEIADKLLELILPGYFAKYSPDCNTLKYYVGEILLEVERPLTKQIALALTTVNHVDCIKSLKEQARDICYEFLQTVPKLRSYLVTDIEAALTGDPAAKDKDMVIFCYPGIYATGVYRIAHELHTLKAPYIPRIMTEYAHSKTGIDIHPGARIGKYFFIDHGTGVVIGETTVIGENVKIYQGVTLGALSTKGGQSLAGKKRHPTIEDNVTIYSNATVLGGDTVITKNTTVGGNSFITESK